MGGTISALIENTVGEFKDQEEVAKPVPGPIRLALRKFRNAVVIGKGQSLLPPEIPDNEFDTLGKILAERRESAWSERLMSRQFSVAPLGDAATENGPRKKKVKRLYHSKPDKDNVFSLAGSPRRQSFKRSKSISAGISAHASKRQSLAKADAELRAARLARQKKERQLLQHQKRIKEAKGCRGKYNELCFLILIVFYIMVMIWSLVRTVDLNKDSSDTFYDPATGVWQVVRCNVNKQNLYSWWRMNVVWTGGMLVFVTSIEVFYWFIAPYSPGAVLTTFTRTFARNAVFLAWLILIVIWVFVGTAWFFEAKPESCGYRSVEQGRGLIIAQYCWLGFHGLLFTANFDNRMAVRRSWCLENRVNTTLLEKPEDEEEGVDGQEEDSEISSDDEYGDVEMGMVDNVKVDEDGDQSEASTSGENRMLRVFICCPAISQRPKELRLPMGLPEADVLEHLAQLFTNVEGEVHVTKITRSDPDEGEIDVHPTDLRTGETYKISTELVM